MNISNHLYTSKKDTAVFVGAKTLSVALGFIYSAIEIGGCFLGGIIAFLR